MFVLIKTQSKNLKQLKTNNHRKDPKHYNNIKKCERFRIWSRFKELLNNGNTLITEF